jgi:hypothetical protein
MKKKNLIPPLPPPNPVDIADAIFATVEFDLWDEWVANLCIRLRSNAIRIGGHGVFKELFICEVLEKMMFLQNTDRHKMTFNYIQGGAHS